MFIYLDVGGIKMYKLIVSDFDKTLINDMESIPFSTVNLFDQLRRNGKKIVIATGRTLQSILDYNRDFVFCDYIQPLPFGRG